MAKKKEEKDQPYNLITSGFTLVATVTIDGSANGKKFDNSILGVVLTNNNVGLLCTKSGKWGVSDKNDKTTVPAFDINCASDEKYYVALILNQTGLFIYVDGKKLLKLDNGEMTIQKLQGVEYFYFGADSNAQSKGKKTKTDVTIKNVLLYNRPFTDDEITKLKPKKIERTTQVISQGKDNEIVKSDGGTNNTNTSLPSGTQTPTENEKEEQSSSPPPTTEDSAARVGVAGVLCFMLFGVFTLLGRYVY